MLCFGMAVYTEISNQVYLLMHYFALTGHHFFFRLFGISLVFAISTGDLNEKPGV
jgi:hypothetical protein